MSGDRAFWAKCRACSHCWPAAYLPMEMAACAKLLKRAACPKCGATGKQVGIAKQDDGVLQEPADATLAPVATSIEERPDLNATGDAG